MQHVIHHPLQVETLLKLMANANRLAILCRLRGREHTVTQLVAETGLSQSAVSQHLAKMRQAGLVKTRKKQQHVYYSLHSGVVRQIIEVLHQHYGCGA